jgi:Spy/CpxP family protein refolding chaperone
MFRFGKAGRIHGVCPAHARRFTAALATVANQPHETKRNTAIPRRKQSGRAEVRNENVAKRSDATSPNPEGKIMKKTWLKRTLLGVAVSTALLGTVAAYSQGAGFHHGPPTAAQIAQHEAKMLARIGTELNLNATQAANLKALADVFISQHTPPAAGTDPHAAAKALIAGNTFDSAGAQLLVNQHVAKIQADSPALIAATATFFNSLNTTQQQQVRDLAAKHHGFFGLGGGWGPHGHHGPHGASAPAGN